MLFLQRRNVAATDAPSWAKGEAPYKRESGKEFANGFFTKNMDLANTKKGKDVNITKFKNGVIEDLNNKFGNENITKGQN